MKFYKEIFFIVFCLVMQQSFAQIKPKMNVIVVVIDDVGPAWLPPYAKSIKAEDMEPAVVEAYSLQSKVDIDIPKHIETAKKSMPFLDNMSSQAIVFNRAFATSSICAPSRAGLLTAKYQEAWGAYNLEDMAETGVPLNEVILSDLFHKNGYATGVIGKWHVGIRDKTVAADLDVRHKRSSCAAAYNPLNRGFDYYYGYNSSESKYYESDDLWENFTPVPVRPATEFLTDHLNDKANQFVKNSVEKGKPFFMYYAPMTIHGALKVPPPQYMKDFNSGAKLTDIIAGHLFALDAGLKVIFETLKQHNQDKNTLLIVCSDNGPSNPVLPYSAPLKGGKGSGWLGGSHVPMLVILPGTTKYLKVEANVSNMDIMPTALDIAGIKVPNNLDGVSLKNIVLNRDLSFKPHEYLFSSGSHATSWSVNYMDGVTPVKFVADKDRKVCPNFLYGIHDNYVFLNLSPVKKGAYLSLPEGLPEQKFFYNLSKDPQQANNLYKEKSEALKLLEMKTIDWLSSKKEPAAYNVEAYKILSNKEKLLP